MNFSGETTTVSNYIIYRLQEAGIKHLFGVPGDYNLDFLDHVLKSDLKWVGTCNELNAGYATDGYARLKGFGAAVVTYGVGGYSIINAVAGAYSEQVPMLVISGAPPSLRRQSNALMHHITKDFYLQYEIFSKVTVDSAMLVDPNKAPDEIDRVFTNCITKKLPVYLELPLDVGNRQCRIPQPLEYKIETKSDQSILEECVAEAAELINKAKNPVVIAGVELLRFGLTNSVLDLVERIELPYATTISSKGALPELHPQFIGVYQGTMSRPDAIKQIEGSDCVLSLGVWYNDFDTSGFTAHLDDRNMININSDKVKIKRHFYNEIFMGDFINLLKEKLTPRNITESHPYSPIMKKSKYEPVPDKKLSANRFYERINNFLDDDMILTAEPGDSICGVPNLLIEEAENFLTQSYYLSIGYCTPASLGIALARPDKRPLILTGDGAFQMTAQEVSNIIKYKCNNIFILLNNEGYLIERMLHEDGEYNDIQNWKYHQLPKVFGDNCLCYDVWTEGDFETALNDAKANNDKVVFIEVHIQNLDCSEGLKQLGENLKKMVRVK